MVKKMLRRTGVLICLALYYLGSLQMLGAEAGSGDEVLRVMVIFGQEAAGQWELDFLSGITNTLLNETGERLRLESHYLADDLADSPEDYDIIHDYLLLKLRNLSPHVVVTVFPTVSDFFLEKDIREEIQAHLIFSLPRLEQVDQINSLADSSVILSTLPTASRETIRLSAEIFPDRRKVYLIGGANPSDVNAMLSASEYASVLPDGRSFELIQGLPINSLAALLEDAGPDSLGIIITYSQDSLGNRYALINELPGLSSRSAIPLLGVYDSIAGHGILGGVMASSRGYGELAAIKTLERWPEFRTPAEEQESLQVQEPLTHTEGVRIPAGVRLIFDRQEMMRWGLDENHLPDFTEYLNVAPSMIDQYRGELMLGGLLLFLLLALLVGLLLLLNQRNRERKLKELHHQQALEAREILLRETHHRIKNNFQILNSLISLKKDLLGHRQSVLFLNDIISRMKSMSSLHELMAYQSGDGQLDLAAYLPELLTQVQQVYVQDGERGPRLELNIEAMQVGFQQATNIGLMAVELLTNSLKYAFSSSEVENPCIHVSTGTRGRKFFLKVSDNGSGLGSNNRNESAEMGESHAGGLGHRVVASMAEQAGGEFMMESTGGLACTVEIPLEVMGADIAIPQNPASAAGSP